MNDRTIKIEIVQPLARGIENGFGAYLGGWRLIRCRPNRDGQVASLLRAANVPFYCPWSHHSYVNAFGDVRTTSQPLFPGYLFAVSGDQPFPSLGRHQLGIDHVPDQPRLIADLTRLEKIRLAGSPVRVEDGPAVGARVEIRGGQLDGMAGIVTEIRGHDRLLVDVYMIGRTVSVELPKWRAVSIGKRDRAKPGSTTR